MTTLQLIGAGVLVVGMLVGVIVWVSRSGGKSIAERNSLKEGQGRRDRFDEATSRGIAVGNDLIERLRNMGR